MANPTYLNYNGTPINPTPPNLPVAPKEYSAMHDNQVLSQLRLYFNQLNNYTQATATPDYGIKSNRPSSNLQIGQFYFDTTLGYPVYWNGTAWVNYAGVVV